MHMGRVVRRTIVVERGRGICHGGDRCRPGGSRRSAWHAATSSAKTLVCRSIYTWLARSLSFWSISEVESLPVWVAEVRPPGCSRWSLREQRWVGGERFANQAAARRPTWVVTRARAAEACAVSARGRLCGMRPRVMPGGMTSRMGSLISTPIILSGGKKLTTAYYGLASCRSIIHLDTHIERRK